MTFDYIYFLLNENLLWKMISEKMQPTNPYIFPFLHSVIIIASDRTLTEQPTHDTLPRTDQQAATSDPVWRAKWQTLLFTIVAVQQATSCSRKKNEEKKISRSVVYLEGS